MPEKEVNLPTITEGTYIYQNFVGSPNENTVSPSEEISSLEEQVKITKKEQEQIEFLQKMEKPFRIILQILEFDSNLNIPFHKLAFLLFSWVIVFVASLAKGFFSISN